MKKYHILIGLLFLCVFLNGQQIDSLVLEIKNDFSKYSKTKNLQLLYSIGFNLPWGIHIPNHEMTEKDLSAVREHRTELYITWVAEMINAGLDTDYDPSDPETMAFRDNIITIDNNPLIEEWKERNDKNVLKANMYHVYSRIMDRFRCYYKVAFIGHEKDIAVLEELIRRHTLKHKLNDNGTEILLNIFKKELQKNTCDLF